MTLLSKRCFIIQHSRLISDNLVTDVFILTDSSEMSKIKVTMETPHSSVKMRGASQLPVVGPDDDLTGMLLQVLFTSCVL